MTNQQHWRTNKNWKSNMKTFDDRLEESFLFSTASYSLCDAYIDAMDLMERETGLTIEDVPSEFVDKWLVMTEKIAVNWYNLRNTLRVIKHK